MLIKSHNDFDKYEIVMQCKLFQYSSINYLIEYTI